MKNIAYPATEKPMYIQVWLIPQFSKWLVHVFSCILLLFGLTTIGQSQSSACTFPWTTDNFTVSDEVIDYETVDIDISCSNEVCVSLVLQGVGSMEDADYLNVYYSLDGGSLVPISENVNAFDEKTVETCGISGSTLVIVVQGATSVDTETYFVSDITVTGEQNNCLTAFFESQNEFIDQSISVQQMIESNGVIQDGMIIDYTAMDYILMNPSFVVEQGAMYHAYIDSCGISTVDNVITIQEYEIGFCSVEGAIENVYNGFTGSGFSNSTDSIGAGLDYKIDGAAGWYTFSWRYASTSDRAARLTIDGYMVQDSFDFLSTGDWSVWNTSIVNVALPAGVKEIRLESTESLGLPNIDFLEVSGINVTGLSCATGVLDCSVVNSAFILSHTNPGCSNDDGTITVTFADATSQSQILLSLDGGSTFPITVNDNIGSYTFTGLSNGQYELAAQYGSECFFNIGLKLLIEDCGSISLTPFPSWLDSYEANGFCWCTTNFDHNLDSKTITINGSEFSVVDVCDELEQHPLFRTRNSNDKVYNDIQCGNGPLNDSSDEPLCPGRVDLGVGACLETGALWDMSWLAERARFQVNSIKPSNSTRQ